MKVYPIILPSVHHTEVQLSWLTNCIDLLVDIYRITYDGYNYFILN